MQVMWVGKNTAKQKMEGRREEEKNVLSNLWFGSTPNFGLFKQSLLGKMGLSK